MTWNDAQRTARLRNYRLMVRVAVPLLIYGCVMAAVGLVNIVHGSSVWLLVASALLVVLTSTLLWRVLSSTMKIVELDHREHVRRGRRAKIADGGGRSCPG